MVFGQTGLVENFEAETVPPGWSGDANGTLAVTGERFKSGSQSLLWQWHAPGAAITGAAPGKLFPAFEDRTLAFWVYNEKPMEQILRLEIKMGFSVVGECWFPLNFKGWRPLGAPFAQLYRHSEHFVTRPTEPLSFDAFRLIAPEGVPEGRLYLDYVNFACTDKLRADNQQPWAGNSDILETAMPEKFIYSSRNIAANRPWVPEWVPADRMTDKDKRDVSIIAERVVTGDPLKADSRGGRATGS
jgi:hypothetical protein